MPTRTYLEMTHPAALVPAPLPDTPFRIEQVRGCAPAFWRFLYSEVGRRHHWVDRLQWTDAEIAAYLGDAAVSLHVMTVGGAPAGYFELRRCDDGSVEIAYFGLLEAFIGRGLGGALLTEAVTRAWAAGASRVWLHTSTLDHPSALPNYLRRGFTVFRVEEYALTAER